MAVWVVLNRPYLPPAVASDWLRRIMLNIVLIVVISLLPGVSAAGHFGGGLTGLIVAVPLTFHRPDARLATFAGYSRLACWLCHAICLGVVGVSSAQPQDRLAETDLSEAVSGAAYGRERKTVGAEMLSLRRLVDQNSGGTQERCQTDDGRRPATAAEPSGTRRRHLENLLADAGPFKKTGVAEVVGSAHDYAAAGYPFYRSLIASP